LRAECFSLPLAVERRVALSESKHAWRIDLNYKVTNLGNSPSPWAWSAHPLFTVEAGDHIVLPDSIRTLRLEGSGGNRLGKADAKIPWPVMWLVDDSQVDLSVAQSPDSGIGDKLFAGPLAATENWCALERPSAGLRIRFSFDPAATPYLGLWLCYGGWPERPGTKQVCVAMEPATAPVDSLARRGPWSRSLTPGESFSWSIAADLEPLA
jgi:galactose mutarotase-like enzyme